MKANRTNRAQAMVEFALALPIFLLIIYGIMEASRAIFVYSQVVTASREGARYASAWGTGTIAYQYQDCTAIRNAARNVAVGLNLANSAIQVQYDDETPAQTTTPHTLVTYCAGTGIDASHPLNTGDNITVTVTAPYSPILPLVPFSSLNITASSSRTILGLIELNPTPTPTS
jgi:Flp pilus assembly protein TadG